jgi:hypothetical protein
MRAVGIWGDHLALIAVSEIFRLRVLIVSSLNIHGKFVTELVPSSYSASHPKTVLFSHWYVPPLVSS